MSKYNPLPLKKRWNLILLRSLRGAPFLNELIFFLMILNYSKLWRHLKNVRISMIAVWVFTISQYLRWETSVTLEIDQSCDIILIRLLKAHWIVVFEYFKIVGLCQNSHLISDINQTVNIYKSRKTHCEPRFTMKWLLAKPRISSNLHAFLDLNGIISIKILNGTVNFLRTLSCSTFRGS